MADRPGRKNSTLKCIVSNPILSFDSTIGVDVCFLLLRGSFALNITMNEANHGLLTYSDPK